MTKKNEKIDKHLIEETPRGSNGIAGKIEMHEEVVAMIAGLAARDIDGIHELGKSRLIRLGDDPKRGVEAEVGSKEAALDIEVIIDHGCDIRAVAKELRERVAEQVNQMAGRTVVEVNLDVVGVHLPDKEATRNTEPRVR